MIQSPGGARPRDRRGSCPDGERTAGDARAERDALLRTLVPAIPVLRRDAASRLHRLRRLQPHAPARVLRRPRGRVLGAAQRRHGVGRRGRAHGRDLGAGRGSLRRLAHVPRPHDVRGEAGEVHDRHRAGRRDPQRPGLAARRREPVVDAARGLGRRPVRARRRVPVEPRRRGVVPARVPDAGPRREGGQDAREARRPRRARPQVLLVRLVRRGRHPGADQPNRLDRRPGVRDQPARPFPRRRPVERGVRGGGGVRRSGRSRRSRRGASRPGS